MNGAKERTGVVCARTITLDCERSKGEDWCSVCKDHDTRQWTEQRRGLAGTVCARTITLDCERSKGED